MRFVLLSVLKGSIWARRAWGRILNRSSELWVTWELSAHGRLEWHDDFGKILPVANRHFDLLSLGLIE